MEEDRIRFMARAQARRDAHERELWERHRDAIQRGYAYGFGHGLGERAVAGILKALAVIGVVWWVYSGMGQP